MLDKEAFERLYREYMEAGGHAYDPWDIAYAWADYQDNPGAFAWLTPVI